MTEESDLRERTTQFALLIVRTCVALPKKTEAPVLGKQMLRSGTSIGANYREAHRARSKNEFIAKWGDSLKEAEETACWLELLVGAETIAAPNLEPLRRETNELMAIFVAILKRSKGA